jgi:hypothetical protein
MKISYGVGGLFIQYEARDKEVVVKMAHLLVEDDHIGYLSEG